MSSSSCLAAVWQLVLFIVIPFFYCFRSLPIPKWRDHLQRARELQPVYNDTCGGGAGEEGGDGGHNLRRGAT